MGIWTPQGWRVHEKRWGNATPVTVSLSGDGHTTFFPNALRDPALGKVAWTDDLHLKDDPFTDGGIYPADPRVEYPAGRPRWAVSHTLLCYPFADHGLYTHEYTWDLRHGHLQTHFRHHVVEKARTDSRDGLTVRVARTPISQTIEGNVHYPLPNSAVRGVWDDAARSSRNYYTRRVLQKIGMHNGVYANAPFAPVVQCYGMYEVRPEERLDGIFDSDSGLCIDERRAIEELKIAFDEPKIALLPLEPYRMTRSRVYECEIGLMSRLFGTVDRAFLEAAKTKLGTKFSPGVVGYAAQNAVASDEIGYCGYCATCDLDDDGHVSEQDLSRIEKHLGREVRLNLYRHAYYGGDWLSTTICLTPDHEPGTPAIADYEYGGGYEAGSGVVKLLETPGPDRDVWVEYHYDAPAAPGENNIRVHLYRELLNRG